MSEAGDRTTAGSSDGTTAAGAFGVGASVERREDPRLITGRATYTDDFDDPDTLYAAMVRSPYGHARLGSVDTAAAEADDAVVAVYTAADVEASPAPGSVRVSGNLPDQKATTFSLLADGKVRYAGEVVAVVVATDRYAAHDAAEAVEVAYDRLDAVSDSESALADDAPVLHEQYDDNLVFEKAFGDADAMAEAKAEADHVVELDVPNPRVIPNAMETRAILAEYDPEDDQLVVRMSTQVPHRARARIAGLLGLQEHRVRVIAPDVGGGFGSKGGAPYHEEPLTAWTALQLERPVKWVATRSEAHRADHHGRSVDSRGVLALDDEGSILGLEVDATFDLGAYLVWGSTPAKNFEHLLSGQYAIPIIAGRLRGAFTNAAPVAPYRGAGRPESIFVVERLVDHAAARLGIDPAELRRRNFVPPEAFPYDTGTGATYDSGDYERCLEAALEAVDYEGWRERQAELREAGRYVGIGLGCFVENTGSSPGRPESGRIQLRKSGRVVAYCGTADHGQGHGTTFAQLLADELGVPYGDIEVREGDTADLRTGVGTFGSRSVAVGASALAHAAREVRRQARRLAAHQLETAPADLSFEDGAFHVAGAPERSVTIQALAELSHVGDDLPDDLGGGLEGEAFYDPANLAYAFGSHVAVVEVDPATGELEFHAYVAVDDCGVQINPKLVEGQLHGGIAQGIGQAMYEHAVYDDTGTLVTGSFQDYAMPKAMHLPEIEVGDTVTPCPHTPTGAKGVGESGTMGAPPAVVNAAVDAVRPVGVDALSMPLTPERVWRAMQDAD